MLSGETSRGWKYVCLVRVIPEDPPVEGEGDIAEVGRVERTRGEPDGVVGEEGEGVIGREDMIRRSREPEEELRRVTFSYHGNTHLVYVQEYSKTLGLGLARPLHTTITPLISSPFTLVLNSEHFELERRQRLSTSRLVHIWHRWK
jgi:hypothetical protein